MEDKAKISKSKTMENPNKVYPGYPTYPPSEDIYNQDKEETEVDPEDTSKTKSANDDGKYNEKNFNQDKSGDDLDIPGSELDDEQEEIGSEDEENNGYSIGSDNHNDLGENENNQ